MSRVSSISHGSWRTADDAISDVATIAEFSAMEENNHPHAAQCWHGGIDPILQLHRTPDREVDASPSTHAAWEYAASLSRNSAHS